MLSARRRNYLLVMATLPFPNPAPDTQDLPVTSGACRDFLSRFRHWDFSGAQLFALAIQGEHYDGAPLFMDRRPCAIREPRVEVSS